VTTLADLPPYTGMWSAEHTTRPAGPEWILEMPGPISADDVAAIRASWAEMGPLVVIPKGAVLRSARPEPVIVGEPLVTNAYGWVFPFLAGVLATFAAGLFTLLLWWPT
jgi:hypothetical protein